MQKGGFACKFVSLYKCNYNDTGDNCSDSKHLFAALA